MQSLGAISPTTVDLRVLNTEDRDVLMRSRKSVKGQGKVLSCEKPEHLVLRLAPTWTVGACSRAYARNSQGWGFRTWRAAKSLVINIVQVIEIYNILEVYRPFKVPRWIRIARQRFFESRNGVRLNPLKNCVEYPT